MNRDFNETDIENLLRGLPPAAASPALFQRVEEELRLDMSWLSSTTRQKKIRWLAPLSYAALGAAAAIAVMAALPGITGPDTPAGSSGITAVTPAAAGGLMPVSTISELDDIRDDGIHYGADQMPVKHLVVRGTERHVFIDPRDGAEVIVEYPRQQSLVLPVSFQ
ncbi:MAG: hypothetical protein HS117_14800 [Verrucomicrobiaceae bacterium]|jgi:hypothetical protein|nr:hypothetical protein [Verrucomicrobiaceae bacterium]